MNISQLDKIYKTYGFKKNNASNKNINIYTYDTGYFHNADIVATQQSLIEANSVKAEFEQAGYSSQIRIYKSITEAESALFDGFFSISETKKNLLQLYEDYCKKHELTTGAKYEYIPSDYIDANLDEIVEPLITKKIETILTTSAPQLIVVEAAAGFGKTTTVYEVLKNIASDERKRLPFLAELSKNRQAQIFKYVLLDEINRQFPTLNLDIITNEVRNGNIILIIDGFDELLRKSEEKDDNELLESAEPMLETISHLLKDNAKIILTTRKTALFSGDGFHCWVDNHSLEFSVHRFTLQEPNIERWVGREKKTKLLDAGFDLSIVPNPVLLSWLRGLDENEFSNISANTEKLIENYFNQLLEREKGRQELHATPDEQKAVFRKLADHLVSEEATTDTKENLEKSIYNKSIDFIRILRQRYSADSRPTEEQIVEKLSLHALLDRKPNGAIGFVNDFVFGFFIGESAIERNDKEWIVEDERFADYAITAFRNRSQEIKSNLWDFLNFYIELLSSRRKYQADYFLKGSIQRDYNNEVFEEEIFSSSRFGIEKKINTTSFSNCVFHSCHFDFSNINQSYFIGCRFYHCSADNLLSSDLFFGCIWDECLGFDTDSKQEREIVEVCTEWEKHVLSKIWPPGAARLATRRAITTIRMGISPDQAHYVDEAITSLKRRGILEIYNTSVLVDISKINVIKELLGRDN